jgi:uncharacterized protein involved in response to NO
MSEPLDARWRPAHTLLAPHRLGFVLAMLLLVSSALWWALVQLDRVSTVVSLPYAMSPSLVHGAVMSFGFIPLFFSGFMFTAGPKWLGVTPPSVRQLQVPLLLQAGGWWLWLAGAHLDARIALFGLALATLGLIWVSGLFWQLIWRSPAPDRVHAMVVGVGCGVGCVSLLGVALARVLDAPEIATACVLTGLWGFIVVGYVAVAHRMIPFFTSSALPMIDAWRPFWVLWLMLTTTFLEVVAVWVERNGLPDGAAGPTWMGLRGSLELAAGTVLLWLAWAWGLVQSLTNRLLAMLHIGFMWLAVALLLSGASQWLGASSGVPALGLGPMHALSMGCLASLMLAMVTRVSCGHSGRVLHADKLIWSLFWLLQLTTVMRIASDAYPALAGDLLLPAALLWAGVMSVWGVHLGNWYGRVRTDGRPG